MSNLERRQEETLPKIIQIQSSLHFLFALDENGKIWAYSSLICGNNDNEFGKITQDLGYFWHPVNNKTKNA